MNRKSDSFSGPRLGGWYCCTCEWRVDTYKPQPPRPRVPPRYIYFARSPICCHDPLKLLVQRPVHEQHCTMLCETTQQQQVCPRAGRPNVLRTAHVLAQRKIVVFQIVINGADCSAQHTYVQLITKCDAGVPLVKQRVMQASPQVKPTMCHCCNF